MAEHARVCMRGAGFDYVPVGRIGFGKVKKVPSLCLAAKCSPTLLLLRHGSKRCAGLNEELSCAPPCLGPPYACIGCAQNRIPHPQLFLLLPCRTE